jgi:rare lipoprotein A
MLWVSACATQPPSPPAQPVEKFKQTGLASFYAQRLNGRRTASGERYDHRAMTAAHRNLPFGTVVNVVNLKNGRMVEVRINDRGPYRKGRIIDLSYAAAKRLAMVQDGVVRVQISSLQSEQ